MKWLMLVCIFTTLIACNVKKKNNIPKGAELQYQCVQALTDVIVYDIINPPVASRMYAYSNLAYYEALCPSNKKLTSLLPILKDFTTLETPNKNKKI